MSFDGFLKSLETDGGKLLVLLFMLMFIIAAGMVMVMTGHTITDSARQAMIAAVSSLLGILYGYLKSSGPTK